MTTPTSQAKTARREHRLSDAMVTMMVESLGPEGALERDRRTENALIRRGLAKAVFGTAERSATYRTGVVGSTTTVYNVRVGTKLTDEGRQVAEMLRKAANGDK